MSEKNSPQFGKGMVSERQLEMVNQAKKSIAENNTTLPSQEVLLLFIFEQLSILNTNFAKLVDIIEGTPRTTSSTTALELPKKEVASSTSVKNENVTEEPAKDQLEDVDNVLDKFKELLKIDKTSFKEIIKISPKQFLGAENFASIAKIIKTLDGKYVSDGRNSHFIVPKFKSPSNQ